MIKKSGVHILKAFSKFFLFVAMLISFYPILWLFLSSFKKESEYTKPMFSLPEGIYLQNYINALKKSDVLVLFRNTVIVTFGAIFVVWILSAVTAFALTKMQWRLSGAFAYYFRLGMFIPGFVLLLPQFMLLNSTGLTNTYTGLILIFVAYNLSMSIYLLNGFYKSLPNEMIEASVIDGCGLVRCFVKIVVPLSINGYVTAILLAFVGIWNDLLLSRTFTTSAKKTMIQNGLATFVDYNGQRDWGSTFAVVCIAVLPTLVIYLVLNKKVIDGLASGALKG